MKIKIIFTIILSMLLVFTLSPVVAEETMRVELNQSLPRLYDDDDSFKDNGDLHYDSKIPTIGESIHKVFWHFIVAQGVGGTVYLTFSDQFDSVYEVELQSYPRGNSTDRHYGVYTSYEFVLEDAYLITSKTNSNVQFTLSHTSWLEGVTPTPEPSITPEPSVTPTITPEPTKPVETTEETTATIETTTIVEETTEKTTEKTTEETTAETTEETTTTVPTIKEVEKTSESSIVQLTEESIPLATIGIETTVVATIEDEEIPQTGQRATMITVGTVLLLLAGALYILNKRILKRG